ncbi:unnamed protein product [Closterium sp. NIES-65]|nr:unnamed protein product [Closterium sp. NIES-65]
MAPSRAAPTGPVALPSRPRGPTHTVPAATLRGPAATLSGLVAAPPGPATVPSASLPPFTAPPSPPSRRCRCAAEPPLPLYRRAAVAAVPPSRRCRRAAEPPLPPSRRSRRAAIAAVAAEPPEPLCPLRPVSAVAALFLPTSLGPSHLPGKSSASTTALPLDTAVMATPSVLTFDAEGRAIDFDVWVDDLQLYLKCDRADGLSLFDLTSGASPAPAADADATVRSQWATHNAAARLAVRRHLPTSERAHFSQYKTARTLYDAVVARYSSPATAALSCLILPYLFPDLAAFPTVADLIMHLRTSDIRYRAALPA